MITRAYRSISARTSNRYRQTLGQFFESAVKGRGYPSLPAKPVGEITLLIFAGAAQLPMVRECLWSIYHSWGELPGIRLVSDGTISGGGLIQAIAWWPGKKEAEPWQAAADGHERRGRSDLSALARKNVLGKKLSAILAAGEREPTLYCDSDMLWFSGPPPLPEREAGKAVVRLAVDLVRHYDNRLLEEARITELDGEPALNTGAVYAAGDVYEACGLERVLRIAAQEPGYFSEQTVLAYCCRRLGGGYWPGEKIVLKTDDKHWPVAARGPGEGTLARHYVGDVRHWFWRDALWMRKHRAKA